MRHPAPLLTTIAAILAAGLVAIVVISLGGGSSPVGAGSYLGSELPGRFQLVDFSLRNYDGRLVRSHDLRGR